MPNDDADVLVIGAGLAGASAAVRLVARGLRVVVIEGRDRTGGRGFSRGFGDSEDLVEFGGAWIAPWHHRIRDLARRHDVALRPRTAVVERRWFRDGALYRDGPTSAADRPAHERAIARIAADAALFRQGAEADEKGRPLRGISFAAYLDRLGAPRATRDLLSAWWTVSGNADKALAPASEILASSLYGEGLTEAMIEVWTDTLVGSVQELTRRMMVGAGVTVVTDEPVAGLRWAPHVEAVTRSGRRYRARAAVVATGLNPMRDIGFDPPLPEAQRAAIAVGHAGRAVKVWIKARGVPVGVLATGGGSGLEWMFSERLARDGETLLVGFGVAADGWSPQMPRDAIEAVARFFPEATFVAADWHDWNADPYSLGTWVAAIVGHETAHHSSTWRGHGRLSFASSDFASEQAGWFEAAVISGEAAAAAEIATVVERES